MSKTAEDIKWRITVNSIRFITEQLSKILPSDMKPYSYIEYDKQARAWMNELRGAVEDLYQIAGFPKDRN